jgi:hypothetical protein
VTESAKDGSGHGTRAVYEHYELYKLGLNDAYVRAPLILGKLPEKREYDPLVSRGLLLEFAALAEEGRVTQGAWLGWTKRYGVLGTGWREEPVDLHRGGYRESLSTFKEEAEMANWVFRRYEAATAEDGPDVQVIRDLLGPDERPTGTPEQFKEWALNEVARVVQNKLIGECYPELHRRSDLSFVRSCSGFGSLVGAIYLQLMWIMTATEKVRRCAAPGCHRIVYFDPSELLDDSQQSEGAVRGGYKSKKYCSDNCRVKRWQHDQRKSRD